MECKIEFKCFAHKNACKHEDGDWPCSWNKDRGHCTNPDVQLDAIEKAFKKLVVLFGIKKK